MGVQGICSSIMLLNSAQFYHPVIIQFVKKWMHFLRYLFAEYLFLKLNPKGLGSMKCMENIIYQRLKTVKGNTGTIRHSASNILPHSPSVVNPNFYFLYQDSMRHQFIGLTEQLIDFLMGMVTEIKAYRHTKILKRKSKNK